MTISSIKYIAIFALIMGACEENAPKIIQKQQPMAGVEPSSEEEKARKRAEEETTVGSVTVSDITGLSAGEFDSVKVYWWDSEPTTLSSSTSKTFSVTEAPYAINDLQASSTYYFAARVFKGSTQVGSTVIGNGACAAVSARATTSGGQASISVCRGGAPAEAVNGGPDGGTTNGGTTNGGTHAVITIEQ